jgi:hypothetical protein
MVIESLTLGRVPEKKGNETSNNKSFAHEYTHVLLVQIGDTYHLYSSLAPT